MSRALLPMVLAFMLAAIPFAQAEEGVTCLDRPQMIETLVAEYGEQLAEVREVAGEGLLELHISPEDGSWTALVTDEDGVSCVIAVGHGLNADDFPVISTGFQI